MQCYDRSYCIRELFFVRFLVLELLSILYFTVVNSEFRSKAPGQKALGQKPPGQKPPDNKPPV